MNTKLMMVLGLVLGVVGCATTPQTLSEKDYSMVASITEGAKRCKAQGDLSQETQEKWYEARLKFLLARNYDSNTLKAAEDHVAKTSTSITQDECYQLTALIKSTYQNSVQTQPVYVAPTVQSTNDRIPRNTSCIHTGVQTLCNSY